MSPSIQQPARRANPPKTRRHRHRSAASLSRILSCRAFASAVRGLLRHRVRRLEDRKGPLAPRVICRRRKTSRHLEMGDGPPRDITTRPVVTEATENNTWTALQPADELPMPAELN